MKAGKLFLQKKNIIIIIPIGSHAQYGVTDIVL